jgi:hypothetical protein
MTLETRRSAEHHTLAANHHEHATRHHHEAAKHFQNDDHAHAAHQAQIAYAHTRRAIRHSDGSCRILYGTAWADFVQQQRHGGRIQGLG